MTYKTLFKKLEKAIEELSSSLGLEEFLYIQADSKSLHLTIEQAKIILEKDNQVVGLKDFAYKDKCWQMVREGEFYLAEAYDFLE